MSQRQSWSRPWPTNTQAPHLHLSLPPLLSSVPPFSPPGALTHTPVSASASSRSLGLRVRSVHSDLAAVRFASRLWAVALWVDSFGCDGVRRVRGGGGGRGAGGVGGRGAGVFGARAREGAGGWVRADVEEGQELPPAQAARTRQVLMNFCVDYSPKKPLCRFY